MNRKMRDRKITQKEIEGTTNRFTNPMIAVPEIICQDCGFDKGLCLCQKEKGDNKMPQFKFKPCPFCGGEEIKIDHIKRIVKSADTYRIGCVSCGVGLEENSHKEAMEFWNKRRWPDINAKEVKNEIH